MGTVDRKVLTVLGALGATLGLVAALSAHVLGWGDAQELAGCASALGGLLLIAWVHRRELRRCRLFAGRAGDLALDTDTLYNDHPMSARRVVKRRRRRRQLLFALVVAANVALATSMALDACGREEAAPDAVSP